MATIQTVLGPIAPEALGKTLIHEHIMVDFIGATQTGPHRWDRDEVVCVMRPCLEALRAQGFTGFVDCTPAYLGRDVRVLARLAELTGLHILTNTGLYKEPHIPADAFGLPPEALAERWIAEWEQGIEGTSVRPGFIKIAVHPAALAPVQQTIVRAAAITHRATGLAVACHTAHDVAARQCLDLIEAEEMDPAHFIVVHADQIAEMDRHVELAQRGAWIEYDSIGNGPLSLDAHARMVMELVERGYEDQLLISQDTGWYEVGSPGGGTIRPYTILGEQFLPLLAELGATETLIEELLVANPRRALAIP